MNSFYPFLFRESNAVILIILQRYKWSADNLIMKDGFPDVSHLQPEASSVELSIVMSILGVNASDSVGMSWA